MRNVLKEFGFLVTSPSTLFIDNQSAISVSKNPEHHGRMKHLDLRYYCAQMVADILTKPLHRLEVARARTMLGIEV